MSSPYSALLTELLALNGADTARRYPVLYVHDGHEPLRVHEPLRCLIGQ